MNDSRRTPRRCSRISSTTKNDFVHECTCDVAVKQFRNDIEQLISVANDDRRTHTETRTKGDATNCCTPLRKVPTGRYTANTPKSKTWFEVLAESPRKAREKVDDSRCDVSCKYVSFHSNNEQEKLKEKAEYSKDNQAKYLNFMMDILHKKIRETDNRELLSLVNEVKKVFNSAKPNGIQNAVFKAKPVTSAESVAPVSHLTDNSRKTVEKQNKELDDIKLKALVRLLENMQSVNQKTEVHQESLKKLTELITRLCKENKMLTELKDNRIAIESKLAATVTENKYLKLQVQSLETDCAKANQLLETKNEEIANLKTRLSRIRETIVRKIDFGPQSELDNRSITLDFDETIASVPSNNESFAAPIRPASSSPIRNSELDKMMVKLRRSAEDEDSGIQTNAQGNEKERKKSNVPANNYRDAITELKDNVEKAMEEFRLDSKLNDLLLDLSDVTYKCSISSLNLNP